MNQGFVPKPETNTVKYCNFLNTEIDFLTTSIFFGITVTVLTVKKKTETDF